MDDHCKDKDCHWTIIETWSYGQTPHYMIEHNGYIYEYHNNGRTYKTYNDAQDALIGVLLKAIRNIKK